MTDDNLLTEVYHSIISELEVPKISNETGIGILHTIRNFEYVLKKEEVLSFLKDRFNLDDSNAEEVFNLLLNRGFIVELPKEPETKNCNDFRSLHMDVLVRSAEIRTRWSTLRYIVSPKFILFYIDSPSDRDRKHLPIPGSDVINANLFDAINNFFKNDKATKDFLDILKEYLPSGLDGYQAYSLALMLRKDKILNVITAPTGSGKTEIFLLFILARIIKSKDIEGKNERAILVYPRKTLSVDQSSRLIRLLQIANKKGYEITFGLRDGHTPKEYGKSKIKDGDLFRGIKCPECGGNLVYRIKDGSVKCKDCFTHLDFVRSTRESQSRSPPDIIITNMWSLEIRVMDNAEKDINVHTFQDLGILVVDEAHEYTGLGGGLISHLIRLVMKHSLNQNKKIIISSATMPSPVEFASKITGLNPESCQLYDFYEISQKLKEYNIEFSGRRLVILGLFNINPRYSWSTYCQLWAVMMVFLNFAYKLSGKEYVPQSIIFINNIKELRRTYRGYEENISLGEPRDHLIGPEEYGRPLESTDMYSYWHYLSQDKRNEILEIFNQGNKLDTLAEKIGEMHSLASEEERNRVLESLGGNEGDVALVLSTSSLELGVDYQNVSFILNTGISNPLSLIQRVGRGGRKPVSLRTVLGIILVRNLPSESLALHDPKTVKKLNPALTSDVKPLPVAVDNPQVIRRGKLVETISEMAKSGKRTYASGTSIRNLDELDEFMKEVVENIKVENDERD